MWSTSYDLGMIPITPCELRSNLALGETRFRELRTNARTDGRTPEPLYDVTTECPKDNV